MNDFIPASCAFIAASYNDNLLNFSWFVSLVESVRSRAVDAQYTNATVGDWCGGVLS